MLLAPQHLAPTYQVECTSHEPADFFVFREAVVCPIVHDVATHQDKTLGKRKGRKESTGERRRKKDQQYIGSRQPGETDACFQEHPPVTGFRQLFCRKILTHPLLERLMKTTLSGETDLLHEGTSQLGCLP